MDQPTSAEAEGSGGGRTDGGGESGGRLGGRGRAVVLVLLVAAALGSIAMYAVSGEGPGSGADSLDVVVLPADTVTSGVGSNDNSHVGSGAGRPAGQEAAGSVGDDTVSVPANSLSFAQIGDWGAEGQGGKIGNTGVRVVAWGRGGVPGTVAHAVPMGVRPLRS